MSILDEIGVRCNEGRLFLVEPRDDLRAHLVPMSERRTLYVSSEIQEFLDSDHPLAGNTQADFNDFILGRHFRLALELDHEDCLMARLDKPSDEVWEIRIYDYDTPQLRFFGRFAACDIFVAIVGPWKRRLLKWPFYERIKRRCQTEWNNLLGPYAPVSEGSDVHAYVSKNVTAI